MLRPTMLSAVFLLACTPKESPRPQPASDAGAAVPSNRPEAAGLAVAASASVLDAPVPQADAGVKLAWEPAEGPWPKPEGYCTHFLSEVGGVFSPGAPKPPSAPRCTVSPPPAAWHAAGAFLDAKAVRTTYVNRKETRLVVETATGWWWTPVHWAVEEIGSGTPPWTVEEPESFVIEGPRLVAYAGGAEYFANLDGPQDRFVRGAFGLQAGGAELQTFTWNPTELPPLGTKSSKHGFTAWTTLPWTAARDLNLAKDWPAR